MALRMGRRRSRGGSEGLPPIEADVDVADEALTLVAKVAILLAVLLVAGSGAAYGYERLSSEQFYPGTRIGGVLIGSRVVRTGVPPSIASVMGDESTTSVWCCAWSPW